MLTPNQLDLINGLFESGLAVLLMLNCRAIVTAPEGSA